MKQSPHADLKIQHPPQTLRDIVLERMRNAIIAGHFKSGERLVERTLCDQLGVSRSVVREVIRYLEAEGLVETLANKGPIVAQLDWNQAHQIYEIRLLLEQSAAAACARTADLDVKTRLGDALKGIEVAFSAGETEGLIAATTAFYKEIFTAAGHDIAWGIVQRLNGRISRLRAMTLSSAQRHIFGQARMAKICEAIFANNPEAAIEAVREHLTEASNIAQHLLQLDEATDSVAK